MENINLWALGGAFVLGWILKGLRDFVKLNKKDDEISLLKSDYRHIKSLREKAQNGVEYWMKRADTAENELKEFLRIKRDYPLGATNAPANVSSNAPVDVIGKEVATPAPSTRNLTARHKGL